jgi:hypothetical protein
MSAAQVLAYPETALNVHGPNQATVEFFASTGCRRYAEIGVYEGDTALRIAELLGGEGVIHLFDYEDRVAAVAARLAAAGHRNVVAHPNSRRLLDSYTWSLGAPPGGQPGAAAGLRLPRRRAHVGARRARVLPGGPPARARRATSTSTTTPGRSPPPRR